MARLYKYYLLKLRRVFRKLARSRGTSHKIALGAALGVFVAFTPTVGFQMIIAFAFATLIRVNRLAAVLPVWITNPLTILPIYSFNYWIGLLLVGGPGLKEFEAKMGEIIKHVEVNGISGSWETLGMLGGLGWGILMPLWLGSLLVAVVLAIPTYPVMGWIVDRLRLRRERRRAARDSRICERRAHHQPAAEADAPPAAEDPEPAAAANPEPDSSPAAIPEPKAVNDKR